MRYAIKLALFCLSLSSTLFAADYRFIKIDFPNASETIASGINARGDVVGRYDDFNGVVHGFLLRNGTFTTIDVPGASFTSARAINARGDIAGRMQDAGGIDHAFLLHDGQFTQIDFPGAVSTIGRGINNAGDVTGNYIDSSGTEIGFVFQDGKFRSVLADPCSSDVWSAMDNGRVLLGDNCAGSDQALYGFLQDKKGKFRTISFPSGGSFPCTGPRWINERGEIAGLYAVANNSDECYGAEVIHGFLLRHGRYIAFDVPRAVSSNPLALNDDGVIVGAYTDRNGVTHGFKAVPKDEETGER
jgi:probable HAF family extracellular repeat protein